MYWNPPASRLRPSVPTLICASVVGTRLMHAAIFIEEVARSRAAFRPEKRARSLSLPRGKGKAPRAALRRRARRPCWASAGAGAGAPNPATRPGDWVVKGAGDTARACPDEARVTRAHPARPVAGEVVRATGRERASLPPARCALVFLVVVGIGAFVLVRV